MANRYEIKNSSTGKQVFMAVEKTGLWQRQQQLWCGECAPWDVDVFHTPGKPQAPAPVFHLHRPWTWTCCCLNRPTVTVSDHRSGKLIGTIRDPVKCCNAMKFQIIDERGSRIGSASTG